MTLGSPTWAPPRSHTRRAFCRPIANSPGTSGQIRWILSPQNAVSGDSENAMGGIATEFVSSWIPPAAEYVSRRVCQHAADPHALDS